MLRLREQGGRDVSDAIVWEDPPISERAGKWKALLAPLRDHPNRWARLGLVAPGTATHINNGKYGGIAAGEFEATLRKSDTPGEMILYVRYLGNGHKQP